MSLQARDAMPNRFHKARMACNRLWKKEAEAAGYLCCDPVGKGQPAGTTIGI